MDVVVEVVKDVILGFNDFFVWLEKIYCSLFEVLCKFVFKIMF